MPPKIHEVIRDALREFDEPPSVTDLRYAACARIDCVYSEEAIRTEVFDMIRENKLQLMANGRVSF